MGNVLSFIEGAPPQPEIDLLPPKFDPAPNPLDRLPLSPFEYMFGSELRDKLFNNYFATPNSFTIRSSLQPDYLERSLISFQIDNSRKSFAERFALNMNYSDMESAAIQKDRISHSGLRIGSDGSLRAFASGFDRISGIGAYGILPLEYFSEDTSVKLHEKAKNRDIGVGFGIGGPAVRYTHSIRPSTSMSTPTTVTDANMGESVPVATSATSPEATITSIPVSPRSVTGPASLTTSDGGGRLGALSPVLPELGWCYVSPSQTTSLGMHLAPVPPYPMKVWAVAETGTAKRITTGIQLSGDENTFSFLGDSSSEQTVTTGSAPVTVPGGAAPPTSATVEVTPSDALRESEKAARNGMENRRGVGLVGSTLSNIVQIDAGFSVKVPPLYEISFVLDGFRKEVVVGYSQSLTVRRRVYNILEKRNVKGIFQYVDFGIEARRQLLPPYSATLAVAGAVQLNRHWMLKGRVGSRDASLSAVLKTWSDPSVTLALTSTWDLTRQSGGIGLFLNVEKGGEVQYQKAIRGSQHVAPSLALRASPHINEPSSRYIDPKPFIDDPRTKF